MRMDELKRGLWGYKKDSVYHYIVSMEEKASARLAEKEARLTELEKEAAQQLAELERKSQQQITELETTVKALREENAALRENQASVFATMLEAQKYAEQLRADSDRQRQQAQERFSAVIQQKTRQLDGYLERVRQIRMMIRETLKDFDERMTDVEQTLTRLPGQAPGAGLDGGPSAGPAIGRGAPDAGGKYGFSPMLTVSGMDVMQSKPDKGEDDEWKNISFT